jgi:bacterioferritin-associated ferredoxin
MFVCICKSVTDTQIREAIANGAQSFNEVRRQLGVATQCCKCLPFARSVVDDALEQQYSFNAQSATPLFHSA